LRQGKIRKVNEIDFLLLSDSRDFATDYIALELERRGRSYLRLDRDLLATAHVTICVEEGTLAVDFDEVHAICREARLKAVYYRAPTYLRETFSRDRSPEEQLKRSQWMSFFRNLTFFSGARWVNSPSSTFAAENKIVQLIQAKKIGFSIPNTVVTNDIASLPKREMTAIKALDTVVMQFADEEGFAYTEIIGQEELDRSTASIAPVIAQEFLDDKVDIRVTVVGSAVFPVAILRDGRGIEGDWRLHKNSVTFKTVELPVEIGQQCVRVVKDLGLFFGGVDLALVKDRYYFIEVNPTGEWAWLVDAAGLRIDTAICDCLEGVV